MNEHKNIITIEDEIKEFSDKPVKSSALFKALEEKGLPNASEASAGDVLSLDEDKKPTWAAPSGGSQEQPFYEADFVGQEMKPYDAQLLEEHPLAICKAYINGIETPIEYAGQLGDMTIWQMEHLVSGGTDISVSIGIVGENVFIGASESCHVAIAESSDTNIVIPSTYNGSGYMLHAAPMDIMEALKRKKYSFSLAVETNVVPQSYGIYPLTFEYYYNGSVPELHAQSLTIFGDSLDGTYDTEHEAFIFTRGSNADV